MNEHNYAADFAKIFNFTRKISDFCGIDVIKKDYKICWKTVFVFSLLNVGLCLSLYTVYIESFLNGNYNIFFKTAAVLGSAIQGYTKAITLIKQQKQFRFLHTEIEDMYQTYESKSLAYKNVMKYNISLVKKLLATIFVIVVITSLSLVLVPLFVFIVFKKRIEILPYQIPFLDNQTNLGYYLTSGSQIVCIVFGGYGNFFSDSWLFIYVAHIPLMKNILKCKFDELDATVRAHPKDTKRSSGPLHDIFKWHQKYNAFCSAIKNTFFWVIFVQVSTEFFGIACTIVCIFLGIWPPAPVFAFYLFAMIYTYCALGNLVESANDDVIEMIYEFCWYNLTVPEQKMMLIMLRESQEATALSIGGVAPLSLNTALQFTKTIYTFSMMLKEFFN